MEIRFTVPGCPQAKQRPRVVMVRGKPVAFTPKETLEAERHVLLCFRAAAPGHRPWIRPVVLEFWFYMPDRRGADWDNLGKLVADALNKQAYKDDRQVVEAHVYKRLDADNPRTEVVLRVFEWTEQHDLFPR